MKVLRCRDVGVDCDFEVHASTEEEILRHAENHGREAHDMREIPDDLKDKVRAAIRDE